MSWPLSLDFFVGILYGASWSSFVKSRILNKAASVRIYCLQGSSVLKHFLFVSLQKNLLLILLTVTLGSGAGTAALVEKDSSAPRVALGGLWWKCTPHSKFTFFSHLANCRFLSQKVRRENCKPITQRELKQIHMVYLSALALPSHLVVINKRHNINKPQCILCACMCVRMPAFRTSDTFWNHICTLLGRSLDEIVTSTPHLQHPSAPVW